MNLFKNILGTFGLFIIAPYIFWALVILILFTLIFNIFWLTFVAMVFGSLFFGSLTGFVLYHIVITLFREKQQDEVFENKLIRIDDIDNEFGEKVFEIHYVKNRKKKKESIIKGDVLYERIINKELRTGDEF